MLLPRAHQGREAAIAHEGVDDDERDARDGDSDNRAQPAASPSDAQVTDQHGRV